MSGLRNERAHPLTVTASAATAKNLEPMIILNSKFLIPHSSFQRPAAPDRETTTGCGDASACLKLRTPLTRRDRRSIHQIACPARSAENRRKHAVFPARRPVSETLLTSRTLARMARAPSGNGFPDPARDHRANVPVSILFLLIPVLGQQDTLSRQTRLYSRAPLQRCRKERLMK